ncbi:MAG: c-type cytochrome [Burkholderiales bacterium]|nr:c-type cytochrome [Burkholderiales bacterium]
MPAGSVVAGLCGLLLAAGAAIAQAPPRAATCAACHGADGNSAAPASPSLAGQPFVFLETQLVMIREGLREIAPMRGFLDRVSDAELSALARFYAAQPLRPAPAARRGAEFARGEALARDLLCGTCHLGTFRGREQMPRLAGQREDYLLHTMTQFRDGSATGRDTIMAATMRGLGDEDLRALAHYFAQLP